MNKRSALLLVILAAAFYSFFFVISRHIILRVSSPFSLAFALSVVLSIFILIAHFTNKKSREEIKNLNWKNYWPLIFVGLGVAGFAPMLLYFGQKVTSVANASFIFQLAPLFAAILGIIFIKEKLKSFFWIGLVIILVGLFLLTTKGGVSSPNAGDLIILFVAFLFGLYNIVAKKFTIRFSPLTLANLRIFFGNGITIIIAGLILRENSFEALVKFPVLIILESLVIYFYVFVVHIGIKKLGASNTSAIFTLTALFATLFAFVFLGESIFLIQLVGGIVVILGLIMLIKKGV